MSARLILAVDTSGANAGVALAGDGFLDVALLGLRAGGYARTEDLAAEAAALFSARGRHPDELTLLAAVLGPGSYTGLRSGLAFLRGLAFTDSVPCVGVGSLELLAWRGAHPGETVLAASPAGADRHLVGSYRRETDSVSELAAPRLVSEDEYADALEAWGDGQILVVSPVGAGQGPADATASALLIDADGSSAFAQACGRIGIAIRVADIDTFGPLVELAGRRAADSQTTNAQRLLPIYVGQSATRPNRDRVAVFSASK